MDDFASYVIQSSVISASLLQSIRNKNFVNDGVGGRDILQSGVRYPRQNSSKQERLIFCFPYPV